VFFEADQSGILVLRALHDGMDCQRQLEADAGLGIPPGDGSDLHAADSVATRRGQRVSSPCRRGAEPAVSNAAPLAAAHYIRR
jgi:hypothetical protein